MFRAMTTVDYATPAAPATPAWMRWTGRVISALPVLMLGAGGVYALSNPAMMKEGLAAQGWPVEVAPYLATLEVIAAVLYLIPRTAVLGAILCTGYLGGAIASHVRAAEAPMAIPAIVLGVLVWLGLWFRDERIRALAPIRRL